MVSIGCENGRTLLITQAKYPTAQDEAHAAFTSSSVQRCTDSISTKATAQPISSSPSASKKL